MKIIAISIVLALGALVLVAAGEQQQQQQQQQQHQRVLRRVIKSTPTATNLGRVRLVTVRSSGSQQPGSVSEISGREAASFGQRSVNETQKQQQVGAATITATKAKFDTQQTTTTISPAPSSTVTPTTTTQTTTTAGQTQTANKKNRNDRQQSSSAEVELLASAPSSWQPMATVEAPVAALIAAGTRPAIVSSQSSVASSSDLSSSSSDQSHSTSDFLRSNSKTSYSSQTASETFARLHDQKQQSFFYPQQKASVSKTSNYQGTKGHWYQAPSTTPKPAPIIQEQYEQQNEQYVEQQQVESAPPGLAEPFAFDFKTQDNSGNGQYRKEESDKNGVVRGSYGYTGADGIYRHVEYIADANGFRANIKSNEPGLIGETQPASIRLDGGLAPSPASQRFSAASGNNNDNGDWTSSSSLGSERAADLAIAPPDFESSHKPERTPRHLPRHFRN